MAIVRGCSIAVTVALGSLFLLICVWQIALNRQAEAEAWSQVTAKYATTQIHQNDRVYWGLETYYYAYAQICYDISISSGSGADARKIVMVSGDEDGGTFQFSGEFPSMAACQAEFYRG